MTKLSKENRAILRACAILENRDYWDGKFVSKVCKELERVARRRGLKNYFRHDGQVNFDVDSEPITSGK